MRYLAGIIAGTVTVLCLIATGVTGLILSQPGLVRIISVLAIAYIFYLAYRIATAPVVSVKARDAKIPSFTGGYVLAVANPKAFAAIGAVYSGSLLFPDNLLIDAVAKLTILMLVIIVVNSAWMVFGSALSSVLSDPQKGRIANIIFALLLLGSVAMVLFQ